MATVKEFLGGSKVAFIGCGSMGQAILSGLLAEALVQVHDVVATVKSNESASKLREQFAVEVLTDNLAACRSATVAVIALKPHLVEPFAKGSGITEALSGKLVISVCSGLSLERLENAFPGARVVRAMTNTPTRVRQGATVVAGGQSATAADVAFATSLFAPLGLCTTLPESHFDTVTALCGSGPAFVMLFIESLADGATRMGLPRDVALRLAAQTVTGAGALVLGSGTHPAVLRDAVTTPGGCTIAGLLRLEDGGVRGHIARAVEEATIKAGTLGGPRK